MQPLGGSGRGRFKLVHGLFGAMLCGLALDSGCSCSGWSASGLGRGRLSSHEADMGPCYVGQHLTQVVATWGGPGLA